MNAPSRPGAAPSPALMRTLAGLDSTAWGDERSRQVRLEAGMVGHFVAVISALTVAAAMVWLGGRPLLGWSIAVIWIGTMANLAAMRFALGYGVAVPSLVTQWRTPKTRLILLPTLAWLVGAALAMGGLALDPAIAVGVLVGVVVGVGLVSVSARRARSEAHLPADDVFED